ncbi:TolC family outer membrane protein [Sphingomonas jatrophae]|nr:TolC family outer membrane protein [Sphingomonas jatrophae]
MGGLLLAVGQGASAETLADAIRSAYASNPLLEAQRADARATDERLVQARAAYGPTVSATASRAYNWQSVRSGDLSARASAWSDSVAGVADQPLFTSGRLSGAARQARAAVDASRGTLREVEAEVLLDVIGAYVLVRRDQQLLAITAENVDLLARQLSDTEARRRAREATATDADQAAVRYAFAQARLKETAASLESSRSLYLASVGHLPGTLDPEPSLPGIPPSVEQAYATADTANPRLEAAAARERISRAAIGTARAEFGPYVAAQASGGRGTSSPYLDDRRTFFQANVTATLPLYNSGITSSRIREAQARNEQDVHLLDQIRREVRQTIAQNWEQLIGFRGTIGDYREAVLHAETAFSGAREQERAGLRTTLDVLDQARDLLDARTGLTNAQANEYLARARLLAALGALEAPLLTGAERYDPERYARKVRGDLWAPHAPVLRAVDGIVQGPVTPRVPVDPAASLAKPASAPLPPEPAPDR